MHLTLETIHHYSPVSLFQASVYFILTLNLTPPLEITNPAFDFTWKSELGIAWFYTVYKVGKNIDASVKACDLFARVYGIFTLYI